MSTDKITKMIQMIRILTHSLRLIPSQAFQMGIKKREEPKNAAKHEDKSLDVGEKKPMGEEYAIASSDVKSQIPPFDV